MVYLEEEWKEGKKRDREGGKVAGYTDRGPGGEKKKYAEMEPIDTQKTNLKSGIKHKKDGTFISGVTNNSAKINVKALVKKFYVRDEPPVIRSFNFCSKPKPGLDDQLLAGSPSKRMRLSACQASKAPSTPPPPSSAAPRRCHPCCTGAWWRKSV